MFASNVFNGLKSIGVLLVIDEMGSEVRLLPEFQKLDTETWSNDFGLELKAKPSL